MAILLSLKHNGKLDIDWISECGNQKANQAARQNRPAFETVLTLSRRKRGIRSDASHVETFGAVLNPHATVRPEELSFSLCYLSTAELNSSKMNTTQLNLRDFVLRKV